MPPASIVDFKTAAVEELTNGDLIAFLRRFSGVMSSGGNASRLQLAADAIERLDNELAGAKEQAGQESDRCVGYRELCTVAEIAVGDLKSQVAALQRELAAERDESARARAGLVEANGQWASRAEVAEAELRMTSDELALLRSEVDRLGSSLVVVPAVTMRALQGQFQSLADECEKHGDAIATTMCEIGCRLIEGAIAAGELGGKLR